MHCALLVASHDVEVVPARDRELLSTFPSRPPLSLAVGTTARRNRGLYARAGHMLSPLYLGDPAFPPLGASPK